MASHQESGVRREETDFVPGRKGILDTSAMREVWKPFYFGGRVFLELFISFSHQRTGGDYFLKRV
jgi:hypothetical protein